MSNDKPSILFNVCIVFGIGLMLFAIKADFDKNKTIAQLREKANSMPIVTVDALGICKVTQGGKAYLLVDVTNEMPVFDSAEQTIGKE